MGRQKRTAPKPIQKRPRRGKNAVLNEAESSEENSEKKISTVENSQKKSKPWLFQKGQSGNPRGRKPGTRNKATLAIQNLLDGEADALGRKAIELALGGDVTALKLCLDRLVPPARFSRIKTDKLSLNCVEDAPKAIARLIDAATDGVLAVEEAEKLIKMVEAYVYATKGDAFGKPMIGDGQPVQILVNAGNIKSAAKD